MAYNYSALLALLPQLKDTDLSDRVRFVLGRVYQELSDAEATAMIGPQTEAHRGTHNIRNRVETTSFDLSGSQS